MDPIYQTRFNALMDEITAFIDSIFTTANGGTVVDRAQTIRNLAECLKDFANKQFRFFKDGFHDHARIILEEKREAESYTQEYVFGHLFRQISDDLTVLRRAYDARKNGPDSQRNALARADVLAQQALQLAKDCNLISANTTALSYLRKTGFVRVIPYAPVALIGIPVTCVDNVNNFRDFLAIPHEIGHYVYWHARIDLGPVEVSGNDSRLSFEVYNTIDTALEAALANDLKELQGILGPLFRACNIDASIIENLAALMADKPFDPRNRSEIDWLLQEVLELKENQEAVQCIKGKIKPDPDDAAAATQTKTRQAGAKAGPTEGELVALIAHIIALSTNPQIVKDYLVSNQEEIFSDVYGTMVGGPALALEFQDIVFDDYRLYDDDGQHPIPAVRPFIHTKTLELLKTGGGGEKFPRSRKDLNERWEKAQLSSRKVRLTKKVRVRSAGGDFRPKMPLTALRKDYEEVASQLTAFLKDKIPMGTTVAHWSADPNPGNSLRDEFQNYLAKPERGIVNARTTILNAEYNFDKAWPKPNFYFDFLYKLLEDPDSLSAFLFAYDDWTTLISHSGWTVGGPDQDGSSPP